MPLNSTLNSSAVPSYRRTCVSSFHMCKDVLYRNTSFGVCLVLCFFGGSKLSSLGFFVWYLCCYPKKIVLYSHVSPVQIQAYAVVRWYALSIYHAICPFAKVWQPLGQYSQVMAASLPGITYSNDVILLFIIMAVFIANILPLPEYCLFCSSSSSGRVVSTSEPSMVISPPSLPRYNLLELFFRFYRGNVLCKVVRCHYI